ncbi:hypothetical protein J6TS2_39660 [Heyndrickxia sporothermodurans]|nr:hypothetical protein J6TS2_39660 [Heyndrickxia sporothermodurans]
MRNFVLGIIGVFLITSVALLISSKTNASDKISKSTDSEIIVDEKGHSKDWNSTWIIIHDPNNETGKLKLIVEKNLWNLIQVGQRYRASYEKKGRAEYVNNPKTPYRLMQITYPGNPDDVPLR